MDRIEWNKAIEQYAPPFGAFLQSYEWGMFQEEIGVSIMRMHKEDREGRRMIGLGMRMQAPLRMSYLYFPKGPLGNWTENEMLRELEKEGGNTMCIRMEPTHETQLLRVEDRQPSATILIDLTKSIEEILGDMKPKTRYNIRLGQRKGVEVRVLTEDEFDAFWLLMQQTAQRDKIRPHAKSYYKALLRALSQKGPHRASAELIGAWHQNRLLAANICIDFAGVRTYAFGATSNVHRNVMAQYVLHAHMIQEAKEKQLHTFDFWGAVSKEEEEQGHAWAGISRYKRSYGGSYVTMPGTVDYIMKPMQYEAYKALRKVRSVIRYF